jgi:hypothetical protein
VRPPADRPPADRPAAGSGRLWTIGPGVDDITPTAGDMAARFVACRVGSGLKAQIIGAPVKPVLSTNLH